MDRRLGRTIFLFGRWFSSSGDWLTAAALGWLIANLLDGGSSAYATSRLITALAVVFASPAVAALLSRYKPKWVLLLGCALAVAVSLSFAITAAFNVQLTKDISLLSLFLLSGLSGFSLAVRDGAEQKIMLKLVDGDGQYQLETQWTKLYYIGRIFFGSLAGIILGFLGVAPLFLLDSLTFVVLACSGIMAFRFETHESAHSSEQTKTRTFAWDMFRQMLRNYMQAFKILADLPNLRFWLLVLFFVEGFGFSAWTYAPEIVRNELGGSGFAYGAIIGSGGLGGLLGAICYSQLLKLGRGAQGILMVLGTLIALFGLSACALAPKLWVFGGGYAVALFGWTWIHPTMRVRFRTNERESALLTAFLSLVVLGLSRAAQVLSVVVMTSILGFKASTSLGFSVAFTAMAILVLAFAERKRIVSFVRVF